MNEPNISQFAFDLGKIMGTLSNHDGDVCQYLMKRGVSLNQIETAYQSTLKLAEAFYREQK